MLRDKLLKKFEPVSNEMAIFAQILLLLTQIMLIYQTSIPFYRSLYVFNQANHMELDITQCKYLHCFTCFKVLTITLYRFLRWAISVYSQSGNAAYTAMKGIMRLPSVSTLKSYITAISQIPVKAEKKS